MGHLSPQSEAVPLPRQKVKWPKIRGHFCNFCWILALPTHFASMLFYRSSVELNIIVSNAKYIYDGENAQIAWIDFITLTKSYVDEVILLSFCQIYNLGHLVRKYHYVLLFTLIISNT